VQKDIDNITLRYVLLGIGNYTYFSWYTYKDLLIYDNSQCGTFLKG